MFREFDKPSPSKPKSRNPHGDPSVEALFEAANRLADARRGAPRFKTRDLVGLLLTHGARTWRNSQPRVRVKVMVTTPAGRNAVRLSLG